MLKQFATNLSNEYHATKTPAMRKRVARIVALWKIKRMTTEQALYSITLAMMPVSRGAIKREPKAARSYKWEDGNVYTRLGE